METRDVEAPTISPRLTIAILILGAALLVSMGGAIVAAPATVPLMFLGARTHGGLALRAATLLVAGLTIAEVAWAVVYLAFGEQQPWIWLIPLLVGLAGGLLVAGVRPPAQAEALAA